jgi:hypothetical protein
MKNEDSAIDPKLRIFLMGVRAALLGLVGAIETYLGIKEKKRAG